MVPHCYENSEAVQSFFKKAKECLPFLAFEPIHRAYAEQDKIFKCVAITHMKNYFKKASITEKDFKELLSLLDTFRDLTRISLNNGLVVAGNKLKTIY